MSRDRDDWWWVVDHEPLAGPMIGLVCLALVAVGVAIVAAPRARTIRGRLVAFGPAVMLSLGAVGGLFWLVDQSRDSMLRFIVSDTASPLLVELLSERFWLGLLVPVVVLVVSGLALATARCAGSSRWLWTGVALSTAVAGVGSIFGLGEMYGSLNHFCVEWADAIDAASCAFDQVIGAVVAIALVGWIGALLLRPRSRVPVFGRSTQVAAVMVFVLGALAFAGTRAHAYDRRYPVSLHTGLVHGTTKEPTTPEWLPSSACRTAWPRPVVEVSKDRHALRLDGRRMGLEGLGRDLETLRRNWSVLHPREVFEGRLWLRVSPQARLVELTPILEVAAEAGYDDVHFSFLTRRRVFSEVLGTSMLRAYCAVDAPIEATSESVNPWLTVHDWLRARYPR